MENKMKILTNNTNKINTNFNGRIYTKGKNWTPELKAAFEQSEYFKKMASNKKDIVGRLSLKTINKLDDFIHSYGEKTYKLHVSILNENSILSRIADKFHLISRKELTRNYHRETGLLRCFDDSHYNYIEKQIK